MTTNGILKYSKRVAILSMIIGTLFFIFSLYLPIVGVGVLGFLFLIVAGVLNLRYLILLLKRYFNDYTQKRQILKTIGFILLNIPVFIVYCLFAIIWFQQRITFINDTSSNLTNIKIVSCKDTIDNIDKLDKGQSKTIKIEIPHDCNGISVYYKINGIDRTEDVIMENEHLMTFKIGTK